MGAVVDSAAWQLKTAGVTEPQANGAAGLYSWDRPRLRHRPGRSPQRRAVLQ
jgi:hypothetical protein